MGEWFFVNKMPTLPPWVRELLDENRVAVEVTHFESFKDSPMSKLAVVYAGADIFLVARGFGGGEVHLLPQFVAPTGARFRCDDCRATFRVVNRASRGGVHCFACGSASSTEVPSAVPEPARASIAPRVDVTDPSSREDVPGERAQARRWSLPLEEDEPRAPRLDAARPADRDLSLTLVQGIDAAAADALLGIGIQDAVDLARADAREISRVTGERLEIVRVWQRAADLIASTSLPPRDAAILAHAGVNGGSDLTRWKAESLAREVEGVAREHGAAPLSADELRRAIEEARAHYR